MFKCDRRLGADQAAAHNGHSPAKLLRMQFRFDRHDHIRPVDALDRRNEFIGTDRDNQVIRVKLTYVLRCHLGAKHDLYACFLRAADQKLAQFRDIFLEISRPCRMQVAAQSVGFFNQGDVVPALRCCNSRFHTAGAAARDEDFFKDCRGRTTVPLRALLAHKRVHRALDGLTLRCLAEALIAAETGSDVVRPVVQGLVRNIRIRQEGASDLNDIRLAGSDDVLHMGGIIQGADTGYRFFDRLPDTGSEIDVDSSRIKCRRMSAAEHVRIFVISAGNVEEVHLVLNHLCHFNALFRIKAVRLQVVAGEAALDREPRPDIFPDLVQSQHEEARAVLEGASEFVLTVVGRRQELGHQPAVRRVHLHHVKAAVLAELCRFSIGFDDFIDQFFRHFQDFPLGQALCDRPVSRAGFILVAADGRKAAEFAAVGELDVGVRSGIVDHAGRFREHLLYAERIQLELFVVGAAGCGMNDRLAVCDNGGAALGLLFQVGRHFHRHMAFRRHHARRGGSGNDTVFQFDIADADRLKEMGIALFSGAGFCWHGNSSVNFPVTVHQVLRFTA